MSVSRRAHAISSSRSAQPKATWSRPRRRGENGLASMPLLVAALAADELWDDAGRRRLLERVTEFDRAHGDLNELCLAQRCAVESELRAGRFGEALTLPRRGTGAHSELWVWQGRAAE